MKTQLSADVSQKKLLNLYVLDFCHHSLNHILQIKSKLKQKKQLNEIDTAFIERSLQEAQQALHLLKEPSPQQQLSLKYFALLVEVSELAAQD